MSDPALATDESVDHTPGPLPGSREFAMNAEVARLQPLNRLEARLAQAIRRMVQP